jgi:putative transposase
MCEVLKVSTSGYYKWLKQRNTPSAHQIQRRRLMKRIQHFYYHFKRRAGSPTITSALHQEGWRVSSRTVSNLMKEMGLRSITVRKYKATTNSKHSMPVHENLLNQQFKVSAPNKVWVTDITYIGTGEGWLYLASVMDLYSRKIVGWSVGPRMTRELVLDALDQAYERRQPEPGLIHHSDRGSQYASEEYRERLKKYGMVGSMSRKGNCYDNACIESFHSTMKKELVYQTKFRTRKQAERELYIYIELDYNRLRYHSALGYRTAHQFELMYYKSKASA